MQVQASSNIKFKANQQPQNRDMVPFVELDDRQLKNLAYAINNKKNQQEHKNSKLSLAATFMAMPIVDTIASGILVHKSSSVPKEYAEAIKKAPLATRVFSAGRTASGWAMGLGLIGVYNAAKYSLSKNSPSVRKFERKHQFMDFIMDMAVLTTGFVLAQRGALNILKTYLIKHPEKQKKYDTKFVNLTNKLNNTNFNKNTLPKLVKKVSNFAEKMPGLAKFSRFTLANSMWILLGAGLVHMSNQNRKQQEQVGAIYNKLKTVQTQAIENMGNK